MVVLQGTVWCVRAENTCEGSLCAVGLLQLPPAVDARRSILHMQSFVRGYPTGHDGYELNCLLSTELQPPAENCGMFSRQ
jgi:hypothetical protein